MKYNNLLILFFCSFLLIGCKDNTAENSEATNQSESSNAPFKVTLSFTAKTNDDFCLLYTEDGTINFGEKGIWKAIEGSDKEQSVVFEFPADIFPTELRLDLGIKPEQTDILIKSVTLEYKDKKRDIVGAELGVFFRADENTCKFDPTTGIVKANMKAGVRQNPSLYPQEVIMKQEIEKLAK
jgi:hypothetical protein